MANTGPFNPNTDQIQKTLLLLKAIYQDTETESESDMFKRHVNRDRLPVAGKMHNKTFVDQVFAD